MHLEISKLLSLIGQSGKVVNHNDGVLEEWFLQVKRDDELFSIKIGATGRVARIEASRGPSDVSERILRRACGPRG